MSTLRWVKCVRIALLMLFVGGLWAASAPFARADDPKGPSYTVGDVSLVYLGNPRLFKRPCVVSADRVYRGRMSDAQAIAELERCAGSQFDPRVVAALVEELAPPVAAGL